MTDRNKQHAGGTYVTIDGQKVFLDSGQLRAWNHFKSHVRAAARRTYSCGQPDFRKCKADCGCCPWQQNGILLHYDAFDEKGLGYLMHGYGCPSPEDLLSQRERMQQLYMFLDAVVDKGSEILRLRMLEDKTFDEIARLTGLKLTTVRYRLQKLITELRRNKKYFWD